MKPGLSFVVFIIISALHPTYVGAHSTLRKCRSYLLAVPSATSVISFGRACSPENIPHMFMTQTVKRPGTEVSASVTVASDQYSESKARIEAHITFFEQNGVPPEMLRFLRKQINPLLWEAALAPDRETHDRYVQEARDVLADNLGSPT